MNDVLKPTFQGEMMLAGWKESHNGGCVVSLWLPDPKDLDAFRGLTAKKGNTAGQRFMAVLVEIPDGEIQASDVVGVEAAGANTAIRPDEPRAAGNQLARDLHVNGYFRNPKLWERMEAMGFYTQAAHKAWIEAQPCLFEKEREARHGPCSGDIVLHHCKSAANSGVGIKPDHWYGVPLCAIGHHQNWVHASLGANREEKQRLLEVAVDMTAGQMKISMKAWCGIASLAEITAEILADFERAIGL